MLPCHLLCDLIEGTLSANDFWVLSDDLIAGVLAFALCASCLGVSMKNADKYHKNIRSEMIEFLPSHYSKVLDIGCAEGRFRRNLQQTNEYWGVELVSSVADIAAKQLDKVLTGSYLLVEDDLPDNYFDLVICNDVIEHMNDHDDFLQRIKKKMTANGVLVASMPNVRYLPNLMNLVIKKDWQYQDDGILDRTHLRFFTQKSLISIFRDNGYVIEKMVGINRLFFSGFWLKIFLYALIVRALGQDTLYLQFALRASKDTGKR